jgi:hypothetical protein
VLVAVSDDEHIGLETCRELEINKYIERKVIYQEFLQDARTTEH